MISITLPRIQANKSRRLFSSLKDLNIAYLYSSSARHAVRSGLAPPDQYELLVVRRYAGTFDDFSPDVDLGLHFRRQFVR